MNGGLVVYDRWSCGTWQPSPTNSTQVSFIKNFFSVFQNLFGNHPSNVIPVELTLSIPTPATGWSDIQTKKTPIEKHVFVGVFLFVCDPVGIQNLKCRETNLRWFAL